MPEASDLPQLEDVNPDLILPPEVIDQMTEDELAAYLEILKASTREWRLTPVQQRAEELADHVDQLLYGGAAGGGKELSLDTRIPVPSGVKLMGDLVDGDEVFDEKGLICRVVKAHDVRVPEECYRLTFDDGATIDAGADHLWFTYTAADLAQMTRSDPEWRARRRAKRPSKAKGNKSPAFVEAIAARNAARARAHESAPPAGAVRSTKEIVETLFSNGRSNHAIPVAGSLELPEREFIVDPYVLGAWLGDGSKSNGVIHGMDLEIINRCAEHYERGFTGQKAGNRAFNFGFKGLVTDLKRIGVFENKHVPEEYFRGSHKQRLALLQGLMDTDGTVAKTSGSVEFCNTNWHLVDAVYRLAASLGHKVSLPREGRAKLNGQDYGPKWTLKWMAPEHVFHLARKAEIQSLGKSRKCRFRYIVSAERIDPVPMRCITVDSPSNLYLAGDSSIVTHNTEWMLYRAYHECVRHPGLRVLGVRRTFPQLRKSLIERSLLRFLTQDPVVCKYMPSEKRWKFDNGSEIEFGFCDSEEDYRHYLSAEYDLIIFEELTEFTEMQFKMIASRCRTTTKKLAQGIRPHVIAATNPGQVGHDWVLKYFIRSTDYGEKIALRTVEVNGKTMDRKVGFVPAKVSDNPHIDPNYVFNLGDLDENKRKQYLDGDWDAFEGQFFTEFSKVTHVIEPFAIPESWPRVRGIDYGTAKPYACVWIAFDWDGNAYVYREDYQTGLTALDQAKRVVQLSKLPDSREVYGKNAGRAEDFDRTVADPSVFNKTGNGESIAAMYRKGGLVVTKAMNARVDGWSRVRDYLRGNDHPHLRVFSTCTALIDELTAAVYDKSKYEDLDTTGNDHALDALRYALMSRNRAAKKPKDRSISRVDAVLRARRNRGGDMGQIGR